MIHEYTSVITRGVVGISSSVLTLGMSWIDALELWLRLGALGFGMCVSATMVVSLVYTIRQKRLQLKNLKAEAKQKQKRKNHEKRA